MSEDIQKGTAPVRRQELPREDERTSDSEYLGRSPTRYPWQVFAAAVIWINCGGLALAGGILMVSGPLRPENTETTGRMMSVVLVGGFYVAFFGLWCAALNIVGIQTIRGASRGTLWEGIGSIVLSLPALLCSLPFAIIDRMAPENLQGWPWVGDVGVIGICAAAGLLAAGVLALLGRRQYERWRLEQKLRQQ